MSVKGGKKLRDRLARIAAKNQKVHVGFLAGATYPDGISVAQVASLNEFGRDGVPPRPFFRRAIAANSKSWGPQLATQLHTTNYDVKLSLGRMGEVIAGQIAESITIFDTPALAQITIDRKGFEKPLVDTGHMLASISYELT